MTISPIQSFVGANNADSGVSPATEGKIREILNPINSFTGGNPLPKLKDLVSQLGPDEKAALKARLEDPNDDLAKLADSQLNASDHEELMTSLAPGDVDNPQPKPKEEITDTTHAKAAQGDPQAIEADDTEMSIDQWNYYKANGDGEDVKGQGSVDGGQTEAMIAKNGGDRGAKMTAKQYNELFNNTPVPPTVHRDPVVPVAVSPDKMHAQAAQGNPEAIGNDGDAQMTIDQWNYYRANGDGEDVKGLGSISNGQTDAMLAARGGNRDAPISVKEYLDLLAKTAPPAPEPPVSSPRIPTEDDLAARIFAAQMRREG